MNEFLEICKNFWEWFVDVLLYEIRKKEKSVNALVRLLVVWLVIQVIAMTSRQFYAQTLGDKYIIYIAAVCMLAATVLVLFYSEWIIRALIGRQFNNQIIKTAASAILHFMLVPLTLTALMMYLFLLVPFYKSSAITFALMIGYVGWLVYGLATGSELQLERWVRMLGATFPLHIMLLYYLYFGWDVNSLKELALHHGWDVNLLEKWIPLIGITIFMLGMLISKGGSGTLGGISWGANVKTVMHLILWGMLIYGIWVIFPYLYEGIHGWAKYAQSAGQPPLQMPQPQAPPTPQPPAAPEVQKKTGLQFSCTDQENGNFLLQFTKAAETDKSYRPDCVWLKLKPEQFIMFQTPAGGTFPGSLEARVIDPNDQYNWEPIKSGDTLDLKNYEGGEKIEVRILDTNDLPVQVLVTIITPTKQSNLKSTSPRRALFRFI